MWFVARREAVENAVRELVSRRIHELLPGYLCMAWTAARAGTTSNLRPDFATFYDYFLRVPDAPPNRPYLRPFISSIRRGPRSLEGIWYQRNVAGSYAPSSVRPNQPFDRVVVVPRPDAAARKGWELRYNHPQLALKNLAYGRRLPVGALSLFLYREFAFDMGERPDVSSVVDIFRYEFGYYSHAGGVPVSGDFDTLYEIELAGADTTDWFEEFPS
jgi:hypothetical protein